MKPTKYESLESHEQALFNSIDGMFMDNCISKETFCRVLEALLEKHKQ